jgi:DNA-binding transcriptional regulator LsrR (DeoR family)
MDKLKILFVILVTAASGLAVSLFLLTFANISEVSPLALISRLIFEGSFVDIPFFIPLAPLMFLATVLASVVGVIYFFVVPEIKAYSRTAQESEGRMATKIVMQTLNQEERSIITVLQAHQGKYLQKYITKEAGLSRLKTHRIIARFAERGIVTVAKRGNTNEVTLAPWFEAQ